MKYYGLGYFELYNKKSLYIWGMPAIFTLLLLKYANWVQKWKMKHNGFTTGFVKVVYASNFVNF
jgi:hypothetical protein